MKDITPDKILGSGKNFQDFFGLTKIGIPIVILVYFLTGIYIVGPDEQCVVRRFGRAIKILGPGPHYHIPWPVEVVDKPKIMQIKRMEIGFRTVYPGPPARYRFYPEESLMLTSDENIVDAQITVQYRIKDTKAYLFNVRDLEGSLGTLKDAAEVALRQVIGQSKIDEALTVGKFQIEAETKELLQKIMDRYGAGLLITEVKLQTVRPPEEVAGVFDDVVSAKEDKDKFVKQAEGYYEDIIPKARGEAESIIREAEGYKEDRIKRAQGDADKFLVVLKEYKNAKDITRKRLYLETMEEILPGIKKFVIDSDVGGNILQLLPLEKTAD